MQDRQYYVYILTNVSNSVLYTGITNNLSRRLEEHRSKVVKSFTSRYNVTKLVHIEEYGTAHDAIAREKQIKGGSRAKKVALIRSVNPEWKDLAPELLGAETRAEVASAACGHPRKDGAVGEAAEVASARCGGHSQ